MARQLDDATVEKILELYKKVGSYSKVAKSLGLERATVKKYIFENKDRKPETSPNTVSHAKATKLKTNPVQVDIHDVLSENTLKALHMLAVRENFAGIDDCLKELIDLYVVVTTGYERVTWRQSFLKQDKEHYIPLSKPDYWFGYSLSSIESSAVSVLASLLNKKAGTALQTAQTVVNSIIGSPNFIEMFSKSFREWYDQNKDSLNRTTEADIGEDLVGLCQKMFQWVIKRAYPRAIAIADLEPEP